MSLCFSFKINGLGELSHHFSVEYCLYIMSDIKTTSQVTSNFIRGVIERDLTNKSYDGKTWAGSQEMLRIMQKHLLIPQKFAPASLLSQMVIFI